MQQIAKEMNYSETTFITSEEKEENNGFDVRIFTPGGEVPFAGHPTLGTAYVIQQDLIKKPVEKINLNLEVGQIPVRIDYEDGEPQNLIMNQKFPEFNKTFEVDELAEVLSLEKEDIDGEYPIESVSTGLPFIIVPLKDLKSLKNAEINKDKYYELIEDLEAKDILIFCPESHEQKGELSVRVFAEYYGVPEDPATGSANGCLAGYLIKHNYFGKNKIDIKVEQGYEIGRPSLITLKAEQKPKGIDISIGGNVIKVAKGQLL
uniref:Phenazine biosynthesis protein PhzF family n=1 Tax=uncultured organism TaxID=155900 RepID=M1P1D9_9ZZZZ|nr:phenazine biosynthesis protein PhzF family [uncultured organism]